MTRDEEWLFQEKYHGERTLGFFADCTRIASGEPLAYIIGWVPFLDTKIHLDLPAGQAGTRPLIPRPETEYWVEQAIADIKSSEGRSFGRLPIRILDLCAGSGCIGVAVLKHIPNAIADFAEIDTAHHATIKKNLHENGIESSRANILGGDLFEHVEGAYDFILSNPPYIDPAVNRAEKSVQEHEPHIALYGGNQGMELILKILEKAPLFLKPSGVLYIEHEPEQVDEMSKAGALYGFSVTVHRDQYGVDRFTRYTLML